MTESSTSTFNRDQLDWRVSSLVAAGACAVVIGKLSETLHYGARMISSPGRMRPGVTTEA